MNLLQRHWFFVLLGFGCFCFIDCTPSSIRAGSGEAARSVIDTALEKQLRQRIMNAVLEDLRDPQVRKLAQEVTQEFMKNAVVGVGQGLEGKIEPLVASLTQAIVKAAKEQGGPLVRELQPEMEKSLREVVAASVRTAGKTIRKSATQGDLAAASRILVKTAIDQTLLSMEQKWDQNKDKLTLQMEQFLLERLDPILEKMVRKLSKEALYGFQEGWQEGKFGEKLPPYDKALHEAGFGLGIGIGEGLAVSVAKDPMKPVLVLVASILGAISLGNLILVWVFWRKYENAAKSLSLFVHQLTRISGTNQQIPDLMQVVESAHQAAHHRSWLDRFLRGRGLYPASGEPSKSSA